MTIVEFLEARIAEDEAQLAATPSVAQDTQDFDYGGTDDYLRFTIGYGRATAECAAKRAIMIEHKMVERTDGMTRSIGCELCNFERDYGWNEIGPCQTLRALAAVYKDHPDYQLDWSTAT